MYIYSVEEIIPYIHWIADFTTGGRFAGITWNHGCDSAVPEWLAKLRKITSSGGNHAVAGCVKLLDRLVEIEAEYCKSLYGGFSPW